MGGHLLLRAGGKPRPAFPLSQESRSPPRFSEESALEQDPITSRTEKKESIRAHTRNKSVCNP